MFAKINWKRNLAMFKYYMEIAIMDSWRSRTSLLTNATVFGGIALFILVLIGLKSGLVQKLKDDIETSYTSVQGDWFATSSALSLDQAQEQKILEQLPRGSILVPEITKIVSLSTAISKVDNISCQATVQGDPFLRYHKAEIANSDVAELVISPAIAKEMGINAASLPLSAKIGLTRGDGDQAVSAALNVTIRSIVGSESSNTKTAFLHRKFMEQLEDFSQGEAVISQGWPGSPVEDSVGVHGYLAFCKQPYSADDLKRLHLRGYKASLLSSEGSFPNSRPETRMCGLLKPHALYVYFVTAETQNDRMDEYLNFDVNDLESITSSDDVFMYWSNPINANIDNKDHLIVGCSGNMRWLRSYFVDSNVRFTGQKNLARAILPMGGDNTKAQLSLFDGQTLALECIPASQAVRDLGASKWVQIADQTFKRLQDYHNSLIKMELFKQWECSFWRVQLGEFDKHHNSSRQPIAIVPAQMLAALHRHKQGSLTFDPFHQRFVRTNMPNRYFRGHFIARVLEDVPVIHETFEKLGYSVVSLKMRVREMQGYGRTLDLLVNILSGISIALGVVTASVIFMEVTRRRQTSIGVMRIMGMDSTGIFCFVFVRAILMAILGWVFASMVSIIIAQTLPILTDANFTLTLFDYIRILLGSILCSALGVSYPAYAATKIDPIDAINFGKVQ